MGNCLAGDTCIFSHDPAHLINNFNINEGNAFTGTPSLQYVHPSFQVQDYDTFPTLQPASMNQQSTQSLKPYSGTPPRRPFEPQKSSYTGAPIPAGSYGSRPGSRHQSRDPSPFIPSVDDTEAFPTLGAGSLKGVKKHHGKRGGHGHGHSSKENVPNSLADVVRMSPSPAQGLLRKGLMKTKSYTGSREYSVAASSIAAPQHIPWLQTGGAANQAYLKVRQDAFKHGGLRNKFLQR